MEDKNKKSQTPNSSQEKKQERKELTAKESRIMGIIGRVVLFLFGIAGMIRVDRIPLWSLWFLIVGCLTLPPVFRAIRNLLGQKKSTDFSSAYAVAMPILVALSLWVFGLISGYMEKTNLSNQVRNCVSKSEQFLGSGQLDSLKVLIANTAENAKTQPPLSALLNDIAFCADTGKIMSVLADLTDNEYAELNKGALHKTILGSPAANDYLIRRLASLVSSCPECRKKAEYAKEGYNGLSWGTPRAVVLKAIEGSSSEKTYDQCSRSKPPYEALYYILRISGESLDYFTDDYYEKFITHFDLNDGDCYVFFRGDLLAVMIPVKNISNADVLAKILEKGYRKANVVQKRKSDPPVIDKYGRVFSRTMSYTIQKFEKPEKRTMLYLVKNEDVATFNGEELNHDSQSFILYIARESIINAFQNIKAQERKDSLEMALKEGKETQAAQQAVDERLNRKIE
jgi:hypothetical protein